jgi:teneurin
MEVSKLSLRWPSALAVSPVDDSLYISDANILLKLLRSRKVAEIVAGSSLKCGTKSENDLEGPIGVAVSLSGTVYVTEGNVDAWKIRKISGHSTEVLLSSCACANGTGCGCIPTRKGAEEMQMPSALAVVTDDLLYVADLKALKVFSVSPAVPQPNAKMEFEVEAPEKGEVYTFNR